MISKHQKQGKGKIHKLNITKHIQYIRRDKVRPVNAELYFAVHMWNNFILCVRDCEQVNVAEFVFAGDVVIKPYL